MCDKMPISAHILKIVENDPFLRLQMTAKEMFNRHQFFFIQMFYTKFRGLSNMELNRQANFVLTERKNSTSWMSSTWKWSGV